MAKLQRKDVKIFASNPNSATQVSTFLTAKNPTPDYSSDPNAIQNSNYDKGWLAKGNDNLPQVEDMNGVMYSESYKNAYLYQMGIAEWNATDEYCINSFCQVNGVLYKSLVDLNIGNNPTSDDEKWEEIPLDPYTGENIGTAEGVFAGKTLNNELQFKTIAVTGNGNITSSDNTITIAIGGGGTGDVYWGAIDGTLSNQSDLQQALNLKQNLIGYTPENVSNKVTTVRTGTVATDTAYPSELATRTAIESAITSANAYTDNALTNLSTNAFVLYANSWTDINTGTLTTTAPTGTGFPHLIRLSQPNLYEDIANFTYTTTQETKFNNTFTYNVLMPIRNVRPKKWRFKFKLSIQHQDVNNGLEFQIFQTDDMDVIVDLLDNLNFQFRQDLINISEITYPAGSTIKLNIKAESNPDTGETSNYDFDLLVYDEQYPLVISRNKGINKFYSTSLITQTLGYELNQEYFNYLMQNGKQDKIQGFNFVYSSTSPYEASIRPVDGMITTNIGNNSYPITNLTANNIYSNKLTASDASTGYIEFQANQNKYRCESGKTHDFVIGTNTIASIGYIDLNNNGLKMSGPIFASANSTYNIGSAGFRFKNLYVGFIGDGSHYTDVAYISQIWTDSIVAKPTSYGITLKNDLIGDSSSPSSLGTATYPIAGLNVNKAYINNVNATTITNKYTEIDSIEFLNNTTTGHYINYNAGTNSSNYGTHVFKSGGDVKFAVFKDLIKSYVDILPESNDTFNLGNSNNTRFHQLWVQEIHMRVGITPEVNPNSVYIGTSTAKIGDIYCTRINGTNYTPSDETKKENIVKRDNSTTKGKASLLDSISNIETYTFNYKDDEEKTTHLGIMAQDLQKFIPECVVDKKQNNRKGEEEESDLYIDTFGYITVLTEAIKELNAKVEALEARVNELEGNKKELEK